MQWPLPVGELSVSERDRDAPRLADIEAELPFDYDASRGPAGHGAG